MWLVLKGANRNWRVAILWIDWTLIKKIVIFMKNCDFYEWWWPFRKIATFIRVVTFIKGGDLSERLGLLWRVWFLWKVAAFMKCCHYYENCVFYEKLRLLWMMVTCPVRHNTNFFHTTLCFSINWGIYSLFTKVFYLDFLHYLMLYSKCTSLISKIERICLSGQNVKSKIEWRENLENQKLRN